MRKTASSLKHAILCAVGVEMINAKTSSINVLNALYINVLHGKCATDFSL